jgi:hypothetical protein
MAGMYATLEEAYKIPSWELSYKRRKQVGKSAIQEMGERNARGGYVGADVVEGFAGAGEGVDRVKGNSLSTGPKDTYKGRMNDYEFGCKQYGICPSTMEATVEGFANEASSGKKIADLLRVQNKCNPLSPPPYEVPISKEDRARFAAAITANNMGAEAFSGDPDRPKARPIDMSTVEGYLDEDLDMYLRVEDMKDAVLGPPPTTPRGQKPIAPAARDPSESPFTEFLRTFKAASASGQPGANGATNVYTVREHIVERVLPPMWMDLALLCVIGILIIVMTHMIFKMAVLMSTVA